MTMVCPLMHAILGPVREVTTIAIRRILPQRPSAPRDEFMRSREGSDRLVVLVHGLTGNVRDTWQKMPDLILTTTDYSVLLVGYPSTLILNAPDPSQVARY